MRGTSVLLVSLLLLGSAQVYRSGQMLAVPTLPEACSIGETVFLTGAGAGRGIYSCIDPNTWQGLAVERTRVYTMPDAVDVPLYTVNLPTANTGCSVHHVYTYTAPNGSAAATNGGVVMAVFVNSRGAVSGSFTLAGETSVGTGCAAGACATRTITVSGT